jgi:hypothetical protein
MQLCVFACFYYSICTQHARDGDLIVTDIEPKSVP